MIAPDQPSLAHEPWFEDLLASSAIARGARVLQLEAHGSRQSAAILSRVGEAGALTVVEPNAARAALLGELDHPKLGIVTAKVAAGSSLGMHDAVLCCPPAVRGDRLNELLSLAIRNLRPGGRVVFDLPLREQCELLVSAWAEAGGNGDDCQKFRGVEPDELGRDLALRPLRRPELAEFGFLVPFSNPHDAARRMVELCDAEDEMVARLQRVLTSRLATIDAIELPFRRLRVTAMR